jgi:hypothetical protein
LCEYHFVREGSTNHSLFTGRLARSREVEREQS